MAATRKKAAAGSARRKSPAVRPRIRLVCLDLDGTLLHYDYDTPCFPDFAIGELNRLEAQGVAWCINSGRSFSEQASLIADAGIRGLRHMPRALMCNENLVFVEKEGGYAPLEPWNPRIVSASRALASRVRAALMPRVDEMRRDFSAQIHWETLYTGFQLREAPGAGAHFARKLEAWLADVPGCHITRNGPWVAVISDKGGKGNVLRAFARHAGFSPDAILAIGDGVNDMPMLDGGVAHHVGCPGDADGEILGLVRGIGGSVAASPGPLGTVEIMRRHVPPVDRATVGG